MIRGILRGQPRHVVDNCFREGTLAGSTDDTKVGWTAGGGAELAIADHLTLKAEALYFDLGDVSVSAMNPQTTISVDAEKKITGVIARGGIGYKF